jgi:hypothetical protein
VDEVRDRDEGRELQPEHPRVRQVLDEHTGDDHPESAADAEQRCQQRDAVRDAGGAELVPHDCVAERKHASAHPLDHTAGDQRGHRVHHAQQRAQ